jgi:DNA-directed RNA polymerase specialized sigma24 family protein
MEQHSPKSREHCQTKQPEQVLAWKYDQLKKWGLVLTRGDEAKAEELVQEFCLYFTLTKPDLSHVANLDGYLFTCLRHIYLSVLARASREALHYVSVADFDSFEFAVAARQSDDPLQRQNDLRRICGYTVWRKESSKSASYFILHFFHGYSRQETAELARLPISAIYNKLKTARSEIRSYIEEPGKLRLIDRNCPPEPAVSWSLVSASELFADLRETILSSRHTGCISEAELIAKYSSTRPVPVDCALLAHIVSCERCMEIIDRYLRRPTLRDREPMDGLSSPSKGRKTDSSENDGLHARWRLIRKRMEGIHEHRPSTLSIAVDGKIIAFHDVQAEHNSLFARIENPEKAQFVEVFSEQDVRFALLPVGEPPPEGSYARTQRVALSDSRWLELNLTFDGLGLSSQVAYYDPALATELTEEEEDLAQIWLPQPASPVSPCRGTLSRISDYLASILRPVAPTSAAAWALILIILFGAGGYVLYRRTNAPINATEALNQSLRIESAELAGQTTHQILHLEEISSEGQLVQQGTVDLLQDGDGGRYLRRLYDFQHHLVAAKWRSKKVDHASTFGSNPSPMNGLWDQDLSAHAFSALRMENTRIHAVANGYELTADGPGEGLPELISATLVLDHHFVPFRETMRVRAGADVHEIRFIRVRSERKPSTSVPDAAFDLRNDLSVSHNFHSLAPQTRNPANVVGTDLQLARLQVAVLYRLNNLHSDTGAPIEIFRTPAGRLSVSGSVGNESLKAQITSDLEQLEDHQLLDLKLVSQHELQARAVTSTKTRLGDSHIYEVAGTKPVADSIVREYFQSKGLHGNQLDSAVEHYSYEVLGHAQRALQNAYALKRLGAALSAQELRSIGASSQRLWTTMVYNHATDLQGQLATLRGQLFEIVPGDSSLATTQPPSLDIANPEEFNRKVSALLMQTQELNSDMGRLFTSNDSGSKQSPRDLSVLIMSNAIPLAEAEEVERFAVALNQSEQTPSDNGNHDRKEKGTVEQP